MTILPKPLEHPERVRQVFVDIETTGLDELNGHVLEVGLVAVDSDLEVLGAAAWTFYHVAAVAAIHRLRHHASIAKNERELGHTAAKLFMDAEIVADMHEASGLFDDIIACDDDRWSSLDPYPEDEILGWLEAVSEAGKFPMSGSSVHFDRRWLAVHLPAVHDWFTYRDIDVSTIKELLPRVNVEVGQPETPPAKKHRVLDDLDDTINLLRHYLRALGIREI